LDALGLSTATEKLAAIAQLDFPTTFSQFEKYLGLTGYLRQYIAFYAAIIKPLQQRKTLLAKLVSSVGGDARKKLASKLRLTVPTPKELNAFHHLQKVFASPSILHHFDDQRQLFIDHTLIVPALNNRRRVYILLCHLRSSIFLSYLPSSLC